MVTENQRFQQFEMKQKQQIENLQKQLSASAPEPAGKSQQPASAAQKGPAKREPAVKDMPNTPDEIQQRIKINEDSLKEKEAELKKFDDEIHKNLEDLKAHLVTTEKDLQNYIEEEQQAREWYEKTQQRIQALEAQVAVLTEQQNQNEARLTREVTAARTAEEKKAVELNEELKRVKAQLAETDGKL